MASVKVNQSKCTGCGVCENICPRGVFELRETAESDNKKKVSHPSNEDACLMCMACVNSCKNSCISVSNPPPERII